MMGPRVTDRLMQHFGLDDAIGIVVSLVALTYLPTVADPASFPKLLVLTAGGLALVPAVIFRWTNPSRPNGWLLVPCLAGAALIGWTAVATLFADAPWSVRLFGWWVRADGLLGVIAAGVLFMGAATLTTREVRRSALWMAGGAMIAALLAVPQVLGWDVMTAEPVTVSSTLGQINFAGAYFAIMAMISLGLALTSATRRGQIGWGLGTVLLLAQSALSTSLQGPMAAGAGVLGFALVWSWAHRGRLRRVFVITITSIAGLSLVLGVFGMFSVGPLGFVGREGNTQWRYVIWDAGWNTMNAHPLLGIGTGSFARYISEFRDIETVQFAGESMRPSAVHSIPLQWGIVAGWPGLILCLVMFIGAMAVLLVRVERTPVSSPFLFAGIGGALAAYLAQAVVSIDVPSILAVGWVLAGLSIALAREPAASVEPTDKGTKKPPGRRAPVNKVDEPPAPRWVVGVGAALGIVGAAIVWTQISAVESARSVKDAASAFAAMANPMVPCPVRLEIANSVLPGQPIQVAGPAVVAAFETDRRCPPIVNLLSQVSIEGGNLPQADVTTAFGLTLDPMAAQSWLLRADFLQAAGDAAGAAQARDRATEISGTPYDINGDPIETDATTDGS